MDIYNLQDLRGYIGAETGLLGSSDTTWWTKPALQQALRTTADPTTLLQPHRIAAIYKPFTTTTRAEPLPMNQHEREIER